MAINTVAIFGLSFIFIMTSLGSLTAIFVPKNSESLITISLGFAAGIMISASVFSLLIPALEQANKTTNTAIFQVTFGFIVGVMFLMLLDKIIPHFHPQEKTFEGPKTHFKKTSLLFFAITIHNIPEGMAVGLSLALAEETHSKALLTSAIALAIGIGIQNFPEGAAVSLPFLASTGNRKKSVLLGIVSGLVEPIFGLLVMLVAIKVYPLMPFLLSVSAGAMLFVVVEELIPEAKVNPKKHGGTIAVMFGFLLMMILDVALG